MKFLVVALAVLATACSGGEATVPNQGAAEGAAIETKVAEITRLAAAGTTPDKAVGAFVDAANLGEEYGCIEELRGTGDDKLTIAREFDKFFTGDAAKTREKNAQKETLQECLEEATKFSLEIKQVNIESPTRAAVLSTLRNVSKIPSGAEPDENMMEYRKKGSDLRFVLEKDDDVWKISQVYEKDMFDEDWSSKYHPEAAPQIPAFVHFFAIGL